MTSFRTNLTPLDAARLLGYSSGRTVVRLAEAGVLKCTWDGRGRRFNEIDVLELKVKRERSGGGGKKQSRAASGLARPDMNSTPETAGGLQ